jgi:hypothetical protein
VRTIGIVATSYSSGLILSLISKRKVFALTAAFPLLMVAVSFMLKEKQHSDYSTFPTTGA